MEKVILKVVEGRGRTGNAKNGAKRFLFTDGTIRLFNSFVDRYANRYREKFPNGKHDYKSLRKQFLKRFLEYQDVEVMDYEIKELDTLVRIGNITKLMSIPYLDIDKTLAR